MEGRPVGDATVTGVWSGRASGRSTAITNDNGTARTRPVVRTGSGLVRFTVVTVRAPGMRWDGQQVSDAARLQGLQPRNAR
jgi:hypothetical protein